MKVKQAEFVASAAAPAQYPKDGLPEVALVGRSNVGKSSFINRMLGRKRLAHTSSRPGKTQTLNFYRINGTFYFVDLPGYGYAQVSKQQQSAWGRMMDRYLRERTNLRLIIQLLDIRHKPTHLDRQMWEYLQVTGMPCLLVATKADKIARGHWQKQLRLIREELGLDGAFPVMPFSALDGTGKEAIWPAITAHLFKTQSP
ncbi:MAG: YihA family ribosome biogenesis GTP-binding protein [Bacillus thermozeamaize]|uniref:Probable GTP-binding protein EngB n=1 Tax=Bacillus thermozeamaize TaxID=230954 RepID=A0A1Y3PKM8_9BACI|nr:MAG: YihA family ribosome biogenesis GTP-binding protein [Bacillus thermozeamaize]